MTMVRILFVCTGNICRSPTAEAIFQELVNDAGLKEHIEVDSAGIHDYHVGEAPDKRSVKAAKERGVEMGHLRARQVSEQDYVDFDYIIAMDRGHYEHLLARSTQDQHHKISLLLSHIEEELFEVPDPYYGGLSGFDEVFEMVHQGASALLVKLIETHKLK